MLQRLDDRNDLGLGMRKSLRCINNKIRARPLLFIRQLLGQDRIELRRRHPRPRQHALALNVLGRRHDHDHVDARTSAGFEQQRNVEHDHLGAVPGRALQELALVSGDQRMNDRLELAHGLRFADDFARQTIAIDTPVDDDARKGNADRFDRRPAFVVERMNRRVGIAHRHAMPRKHLRRLALAHADRSGEPDE